MTDNFVPRDGYEKENGHLMIYFYFFWVNEVGESISFDWV